MQRAIKTQGKCNFRRMLAISVFAVQWALTTYPMDVTERACMWSFTTPIYSYCNKLFSPVHLPCTPPCWDFALFIWLLSDKEHKRTNRLSHIANESHKGPQGYLHVEKLGGTFTMERKWFSELGLAAVEIAECNLSGLLCFVPNLEKPNLRFSHSPRFHH